MANYNRVILVGNMTRDPQMSYLPSQTPVVEFGLAVNRRWRGQDNQQREETCFVDCRLYGRQAETLNQYTRKGAPLLVEGRLSYDTWEGKDGVRRSKHRVIVERFQFLGSTSGASQPRAPQPRAPQAPAPAPRSYPSAPPQAAPPQPEAPQADLGDEEPVPPFDEGDVGDDIPF